MTSVLRSLLNTLGVPPRTAQRVRTGCPAPGRRCRIYRRISILTQDNDGMQKPVAAPFGDREERSRAVHEPDKKGDSPHFPEMGTVPFVSGAGGQRVPVRGPAGPVGCQRDCGHLPEKLVER